MSILDIPFCFRFCCCYFCRRKKKKNKKEKEKENKPQKDVQTNFVHTRTQIHTHCQHYGFNEFTNFFFWTICVIVTIEQYLHTWWMDEENGRAIAKTRCMLHDWGKWPHIIWRIKVKWNWISMKMLFNRFVDDRLFIDEMRNFLVCWCLNANIREKDARSVCVAKLWWHVC